MNTSNKQKGIFYLDRETQVIKKEKVVAQGALEFLYSSNPLIYAFSKLFLLPLIKLPIISKLYGSLQDRASSKKKIKPFILEHKIDPKEFEESIESFRNFNDFFTRKLKVSSRPVVPCKQTAITIADGRYYVFPRIDKKLEVEVKGKHLSIAKLLNNQALANEYENGSLVIARLCPSDYHRFHFPFDCQAKSTSLVNGPLLSVNPLALAKNFNILAENKRYITPLYSEVFGEVLFIEIGATNVGTVHQSFTANQFYKKGDEKGYFSFGGSCVILVFKEGKISIDEDLVKASLQGTEVYCKMGQSLGVHKLKR